MPRLNALGVALRASSERSIPVALHSIGRLVDVSAYLRVETRWTGPLPATHKTVPNKPALDFEGAPLYPEFIVLRLLERDGWGAAWRKNWGGTAFWRDIGEVVELPSRARSVFDQVSAHAEHAGAWDILAWRGPEVLFILSKPIGNDRITAYQARWLDTALRMGVPLGCFAIVEYEI
jgi:hypothetical protein